MSGFDLNLARRPFVNRRPVQRLTWLLWGIGGLVLVLNGFLYWGHFRGQAARTDRLGEVRREIADHRETIRRHGATLAGFDLGAQNESVEYLNLRIRERAFGWSELFDRLAEVLPIEVYLTRVSPTTGDSGSTGGSARRVLEPGEVLLQLGGRGRTSEDVFRLVDNLFAHESFRSPNLQNESARDGLVSFSLNAIYRPGESKSEVDPVETAEVLPVGDPEAGTAPDPEAEIAPAEAPQFEPADDEGSFFGDEDEEEPEGWGS